MPACAQLKARAGLMTPFALWAHKHPHNKTTMKANKNNDLEIIFVNTSFPGTADSSSS